MLTPVRFGYYNLNHIRPGQVLVRIDSDVVIEAVRILSHPVGKWDTEPTRLKISVPVDEYILDVNNWRYTRRARHIGRVFNFNYKGQNENHFTARLKQRPDIKNHPNKKSMQRRWQAKNQELEKACWVSSDWNSDWYPISNHAAKRLGIGRQFFRSEDKLTPEKIFRGVLCDSTVELVGPGPLKIRMPVNTKVNPFMMEPRSSSNVMPISTNSNRKSPYKSKKKDEPGTSLGF